MQIVGKIFAALNVGAATYHGMTGDPVWAAISAGIAALLSLQLICYAVGDS